MRSIHTHLEPAVQYSTVCHYPSGFFNAELWDNAGWHVLNVKQGLLSLMAFGRLKPCSLSQPSLALRAPWPGAMFLYVKPYPITRIF